MTYSPVSTTAGTVGTVGDVPMYKVPTMAPIETFCKSASPGVPGVPTYVVCTDPYP
jgi:hypothetical protein